MPPWPRFEISSVILVHTNRLVGDLAPRVDSLADWTTSAARISDIERRGTEYLWCCSWDFGE